MHVMEQHRASAVAREDGSEDCGSPAGIAGAATWTVSRRGANLTRVHTPVNGRARALVVLVPGVGLEHLRDHDELRQLAMLLAGAGYCVARAGLRGVGDSHGLRADEDVLAAWTEDVLAATAQARALCGAEHLPVHGIGHGLGAAVLDRVADRFDHVTAWEPEDGARFVARWSWLRRDGFPGLDTTGCDARGVDLPALRLTGAQVDAVRALPAPQGRSIGGPRTGATVRYDVLEDLLWSLPRPELVPLTGTGRGPARHEFTLDGSVRCAEQVVAPQGPEHSAVLTGPVAALGADPDTDVPAAPTTHEGPGAPDARGAGASTGPAVPSAPAVLLTSGGDGPRDGAGLWKVVAHRLAAQGLVSLRADGDRAGDLAPLWAQPLPDPGGARQAGAVARQVQWLAERTGGDVVVVAAGAGCSAAVAAARQLPTGTVREVVFAAAPDGGGRARGLRDRAARIRGIVSRAAPGRAPRVRVLPGSDPHVLTGAARDALMGELVALAAQWGA